MRADFLFETSWEVCNKVGGIHTVITTKTLNVKNEFGDNYVLIGPDVWRDDKSNPEFTADDSMFTQWKAVAVQEGLSIRTGRWNIEGSPRVMLVDFTQYFGQQNDIFARFWETYGLDSISGQWDYVEPALFGYAAAKVIESFTSYHREYPRVVAQFHEWMTGTGVLYLEKNSPWIATAFTTHATVLGRSIAGNNRPLYSKLNEYNPVQTSHELNVTSKQSLEKLAATQADVFTAVSEITGTECLAFLGKSPDVVTPNGFDDSFVPSPGDFDNRRSAAREKLLSVAGALLGYKLPDDTLLVSTSGRYEYRNKGIDLFLSALGNINRRTDIKHQCVAFILVPAYHKGPRQELIAALKDGLFVTEGDRYLTHGLHYVGDDPVINQLARENINNNEKDKVKVIFVPSYLNGNDGIFDKTYYDLLIGFDLTLYPSYYEPWGYTPLESLMFHVPTVTTNLSGFGMWVNTHCEDPGDGCLVINRNDENDSEVIRDLALFISRFMQMSQDDVRIARDKAWEVSRIANWNALIKYYFSAYEFALENSEVRRGQPREYTRVLEAVDLQVRKPHQVPVWKDIYVQSELPERIGYLKELATNLWWSWNNDAELLFRRMDPTLWEEVAHNPRKFIEAIDYKRLVVLSEDEIFLDDSDRIYKEYTDYMARPENSDLPSVAYFSMEFGIHPCLKIYSGGLGVLAGDYLKEASDSNVNITGIGLLYRYGYFRQKLGPRGEQQTIYEAEDFAQLPVTPVKDSNNNIMTISLAWPGRTVKARVWLAQVGKVKLYLLDTDHDENTHEDRAITHYLYGGDSENRLKQELILGIGGVRALISLGIKPDVYHSNEGHSAFIGFERMRHMIEEQHLTFEQTLEIVRASTLFTTHTPVPAGHDAFEEDLLRKYISHYHTRLNISWDQMMALGRCDTDHDRKFNMSYLATRLSQEMNGVSELHGHVSRGLFSKLWPGYLRDELYIGHVTNGVHHSTWTAPEWEQIYVKLTGEAHFNQADRSQWEKIYQVDDAKVFEVKMKLKKRLFDNIRKRLQSEMLERHVSPRKLLNISSHLNEKSLTIGFARRFATYKRASLLFRDLDRLEKIVNNPERPVQFIYAGKAHPNDGGGQDLIRRVNEISQMPQFAGKVLFIENYDMELAKYLVRGVDIWLNTPTRPLEASGTSGEKAVMNGTIHFSVLDGWWVEGYHAFAGWALPKKRTFTNQDLQDDVDAETIYNMLEYEIVPAYYSRDDDGIPREWTSYIKNTMVKVAPEFTTRRMLDDYLGKFYKKLHERSKRITTNNYALARELADWKNEMSRAWDEIEVLKYDLHNAGENVYKSGQNYSTEILLDIKNIPAENVGVEFVVTKLLKSGEHQFLAGKEFKLVSKKKGRAIYHVDFLPERAGTFFYGIRIYAKHPELPHRQDFCLLRWVD
ncbi:MAG: alpha-glucan family phosphorylase [Bacteroidales bacterium]|jgi:phosphorylase/glycogen(starch) synthase|nr:alpha-glucan family phosphorylase [Bacteroidales bacterium]